MFFAIENAYDDGGDVHGPYVDLVAAQADTIAKLEAAGLYQVWKDAREFSIYDGATLSMIGRTVVKLRDEAKRGLAYRDTEYKTEWQAQEPPFPPTPPMRAP